MMKALQNKESKSYPCVFTDSSVKGREVERVKIRNVKKHTRGSNRKRDTNRINSEFNHTHIKNLSNCKMTTYQINLLSEGLKFVQTPVLEENRIRQQLLLDFKQFARRMRLRYIFHNKESEQHPFHVKLNWEPPVQQSVALETYLEEVRVKLAEIELITPRNNLPFKERNALRELRSNSEITIKRRTKARQRSS